VRFKKVFLPLILSLAGFAVPVLGNSMDNDFCDGYKAGYQAGYEQTAGQTPTRMSPLCPLKPPDSSNTPDSPLKKKADFDRGYDAGFRAGARDGSR